MNKDAVLLEAVTVSKFFGQNQVLHNIDFDILPGEIHALIGEHGAGKSTLLKILFGIYQPCSGSLHAEGKEIHLHSPMQARKHGIAMINQEPQAFPEMSVFENIVIGNIPKTRLGFFRGYYFSTRSTSQRCCQAGDHGSRNKDNWFPWHCG